MSNGTESHTTRLLGLLGEFESPDALLSAVRRLREFGYRRLDAFSPFPIHGLDEALAVRQSPLAWLVLVAGVVGGVVALAGQWWTNAVDYPYLISGKPMFSLPANIPVTFEVIILCSAFAAFFGVLAFNKLPRLSNPLLRNARFSRASNDRFFLLISSDDEKFSKDEAATILRAMGANHVENVQEDASPVRVPRAVWIGITVLAVAAVIPPLLIARARATTSELPPLRSFKDMDFQPKFKSQTESRLFADGRSMRLPVRGTVARGELREDDLFYREIVEDSSAERSSDSQAPAADDVAADSNEPNWGTEIPLVASDQLMRRGRERFNIYCATCHGRAGDGNGPVSVRALELQQGTWVPPTSIHAEHVRKQPAGKLFNTITNGIRKMPGYGSQIEPEDRWAIVLYLRALQRTRQATPDDLSPEELPKLRDLN